MLFMSCWIRVSWKWRNRVMLAWRNMQICFDDSQRILSSRFHVSLPWLRNSNPMLGWHLLWRELNQVWKMPSWSYMPYRLKRSKEMPKWILYWSVRIDWMFTMPSRLQVHLRVSLASQMWPGLLLLCWSCLVLRLSTRLLLSSSRNWSTLTLPKGYLLPREANLLRPLSLGFLMWGQEDSDWMWERLLLSEQHGLLLALPCWLWMRVLGEAHALLSRSVFSAWFPVRILVLILTLALALTVPKATSAQHPSTSQLSVLSILIKMNSENSTASNAQMATLASIELSHQSNVHLVLSQINIISNVM